MSTRTWLVGTIAAGIASRLTNEAFDDIRNGIRAGGHEAGVAVKLADQVLIALEATKPSNPPPATNPGSTGQQKG